MGTGYEVDPSALRQAAADIITCVQPADEMEIMAAAGSPQWYGHAQLYDRLARFCTTWQVAVTLLSGRARSASQELNRNADRYETAEQCSTITVAQAGGPLPI